MERILLIVVGVGLICLGFFTSSWALQLFFGIIGGVVIFYVLEEVGE
jgi:hypothetical protein